MEGFEDCTATVIWEPSRCSLAEAGLSAFDVLLGPYSSDAATLLDFWSFWVITPANCKNSWAIVTASSTELFHHPTPEREPESSGGLQPAYQSVRQSLRTWTSGVS